MTHVTDHSFLYGTVIIDDLGFSVHNDVCPSYNDVQSGMLTLKLRKQRDFYKKIAKTSS